MNTPDQYKDEAMRFLDMYPLEACERVAARLNGRGWTLNKFDCKVEIFESIRWYAKVRIRTDVTKKTGEEKWAELQKVFTELDLSVELTSNSVQQETEIIRHRSYDQSAAQRILRGHWYEFYVEFKPAKSLELSVLTEEEA
jgi:hypothetical protein